MIQPENINFIIGTMKSGTTALYDSLKAHPEICAGSSSKEPNFFASEEIYERGWVWYQQLWNDWNPAIHKKGIDASTSYSKSGAGAYLNSAKLIKDFNPRAKFIYILRNPFERIRSHYQMALEKGWNYSPLKNGVNPHAIQISMYFHQLEKYREHFPKESILLVDYQHMISCPDTVIAKTLRHLELDESILIKLIRSHDSVEDYLLPRLHRLLVKMGYRINFGENRQAFAAYVNTLPKDFVNQIIKEASIDFTLSEENRDQISSALASDMQKLKLEYGFDTTQWNF